MQVKEIEEIHVEDLSVELFEERWGGGEMDGVKMSVMMRVNLW